MVKLPEVSAIRLLENQIRDKIDKIATKAILCVKCHLNYCFRLPPPANERLYLENKSVPLFLGFA
jgi:hypothetical protein